MSEPLFLPTGREGLVLRQLSDEADDRAYNESYNASRPEIEVWDPDSARKHRTVEDTTASRLNCGDKLRMGVWSDGTFVGSVNATPDENGLEIGYWTDSRHTGQGIATLATRALSNYLAIGSNLHANVRKGNDASARVLKKAGFEQAGSDEDLLHFERKKIPPVLFPNLWGKERAVGPGEYKVLDGSDEPARIRKGQIFLVTEGPQLTPDPFPGVHARGIYDSEGLASGAKQEQIISFLYHKLDSNGQLETTERAIIFRGIGYGVHPGHIGQEPTWYLVGPQLGTIDPETGLAITMPEEDMDISAKHFSMACITGGPLGEPVLANPLQEQ